MRTVLALATLSVGTHALVVKDTGCCFHLAGHGGPGGEIDQLSDGQNRIGQSGLSAGQYCIGGDGGLTDSSGRGCIFTPATGQWQCDDGKKATPGFALATNGTLSHDGSTSFQACPTGNNGGYNIYRKPLMGEPGCVPIWLEADSCKATAPPVVPMSPKSACPADLPAKFEFPHLIIPIDSANANTFVGTSYNGSAHGTESSIFSFDIPQSAAGKICNLKFLFPQQSQLETSAFTFGGAGVFKFAVLSGPATENTTYASSPKVKQDFGNVTMAPGNAYDIASIACPAGQAIAIWFHALGDAWLDYFQDFNPCPIGLYIIAE